MKENNKLVLKSIYQLLDHKFLVPAYQRGFRWDKETQVTQLLDDIWEFANKTKSNDEFYCLQPIVVKARENNTWEVIDGQQRLTTIRIVLSYLVKVHLKRPLKEAFKKDEFSIEYETRRDSEAFLKDIKENYKNIDFYYMWSAYQTTENWFKDKDYNECNKFIHTLLAKEDKDNPVKVIWYEINTEADSIDIFTRLNIGKIPLTNAELIKALFLRSAKPDNKEQKANDKQLQIASEWDAIESRLQDDSFWFFIYDKNNYEIPQHNYDTRIEYIFDLIKNKPPSGEKYYTFYRFLKEDFEHDKTIEDMDIWLDIKKYFRTFEEWYNDREFYHLTGFLIATENSLKNLKDKADSKGMTKSEFRDYLKREIATKVDVDIDALDYQNSKDKPLINIVLLLMNIQTLLSNGQSKSRFPFDSYKNGSWDIEHIRSQAEVELKGNDCIDWAKLVLEYYTGIPVTNDDLEKQKTEIASFTDKEEKQIGESLINFIKNNSIKEEFNKLYKRVSEAFREENPPSGNSIANLALLDSGTNRAYKNAFFPIKRMEIMKRELKGSFVPICTKNVFMKAYSRRFDKIMYWDKTDADDYLKAIKSCLEVYFNKKAEK